MLHNGMIKVYTVGVSTYSRNMLETGALFGLKQTEAESLEANITARINKHV